MQLILLSGVQQNSPKSGSSILFLSYDGLCDSLGQSQVLPYIEGLGNKGYHFALISFEKPDRYRFHGAAMRRRCAKSNITWHPLTYTKNPPIASTIYDMVRMYRAAVKLHQRLNFQLIHARSYPPAIVAAKLKKSLGIPFIFDMRGFYADERVDGRIWNLQNPVYRLIYRYFKRRERELIREAAAVVSLTQAGKVEVSAWLAEELQRIQHPDYYTFDVEGQYAKKIKVIPCMVDVHHFDPAQIKSARKEWIGAVHGIDTQYEYLGYVGSVGTWYLAKEMLDCYNHIRKAHPKVRFLLVSNDDSASIKDYARTLGIPDSHFIHVSATRKEVPALMSLMKAAIFFIMPAYSKKASSPTKQAELMAMGLPIICNAGVGDTAEIVTQSKAGIVLDACTPEHYARAAAQWDELTAMAGTTIRQAAVDTLSLEEGVKGFEEVYLLSIDNS